MRISRSEIEGMVVGQCITEGASAVMKASGVIDETDFAEPTCGFLFAICLSLTSCGKVVDLVQVNDYLNTHSASLYGRLCRFSQSGDVRDAVSNLVLRATECSVRYSETMYSWNLASNCHYVKKESRRSKAVNIIQTAHKRLLEGGEVEEALEGASHDILSLVAQWHQLKSYVSLGDATEEAIHETRREVEGEVVRISTGFSDLDRIIYGFEKGRVYAIAAEEKVGKSLLSHQIGLSAAQKGHPTAIISLEMRASEIAKRLAGVNNGQDPIERLVALKEFGEEAKHLPLFIRHGSANQEKVITIARMLYAEKRIQLLVVDYLQLIELSGRDRVNEINDLVGKLKGIAMDLEIPVVLIAAVLNKQINSRADRKPCPADIRDTGRLANDADCMIFLWRPDGQDENYIELLVSRSRYSKLGRVGLYINPDTLKLSQVSLREENETAAKGRRRF